MTRLERAKQCMPFAALHGYEERVKRREFRPTSRRELSEEEIADLSGTVSSLKKGDVVKAEYYSTDRYALAEGAITEIDLVLRFIRVVKTKISFDDLSKVEKIK